MPHGYSKGFLLRMGKLSQQLTRVCSRAGMDYGAAQRFVARVAKARGLKGWCDTETELDYQLLIKAVKEELAR